MQLTDHQAERIDDVTVELPTNIDTGRTITARDHHHACQMRSLIWQILIWIGLWNYWRFSSSIVLTVPNMSGFWPKRFIALHTQYQWVDYHNYLISNFWWALPLSAILWRSGFFRNWLCLKGTFRRRCFVCLNDPLIFQQTVNRILSHWLA